MSDQVIVIYGEELAKYGFPNRHPFGTDRYDVFMNELNESPNEASFIRHLSRLAERDEIERFHTSDYIDRVIELSAIGSGYLDAGDTPAYPGVYEAASHAVGGTLNALTAIMEGEIPRAFIPIGGLHHAARNSAAGFCVFNDCGVAIEVAMSVYGLERVAYVDIDAHHGDGVFYGFEEDPRALFADIHEDGRFLYPGTGARSETGRGPAEGTKLNIPMQPGSDDQAFLEAWGEVEAYIEASEPQLILLNAGADSLAGDPITHLEYSENAHGHAAARLRQFADRFCEGRILGMGGGGYNRVNLARAWTRVVESFADPTISGF
ncbi:MAG: acetoin utilization protein AcuC [Gammaproteobacteria bacterium]|nr:acetoin utilization protein AcuC [Gammaproteobacteria bacterium]